MVTLATPFLDVNRTDFSAHQSRALSFLPVFHTMLSVFPSVLIGKYLKIDFFDSFPISLIFFGIGLIVSVCFSIFITKFIFWKTWQFQKSILEMNFKYIFYLFDRRLFVARGVDDEAALTMAFGAIGASPHYSSRL